MSKSRLSEALITAAKRQVSALARSRKEIQDQLLDYLCYGQCQFVLPAVGDIANGAQLMKLNCVKPPWERRSQMESARRRFFELAGKEAPALIVRFAKIAEAVGGRNVSPVWEALPEDLRWFDVLLNEGMEICTWRCRNPLEWDLPFLQSILAADDQSLERLPALILSTDSDDQFSGRDALLALPGMAEEFAAHPDVVARALQQHAAGKLHAFAVLESLGVSLQPHLGAIAELALDRAKSVREAAMEALKKLDKPLVRKALEHLASNGPAPQRQQGVVALWELCGTDVSDFLIRQAERERSQKVRQEIERLTGSATSSGDDESDLAPVAACSSTVTISEVVADAFSQAVMASDAAAKKARRPRGHRKAIPDAIEFLRQGGKLKRFANALRPDARNDATWQPYRELIATQDLSLVGVWRLLHLLGCLDSRQEHSVSHQGTILLLGYRRAHAPGLDLRQLGAAARAARLSTRFVAAIYLADDSNALDLVPDAIWPFFTEHPRYLREVLAPRKQDNADPWQAAEQRQHAFRLLAMFPEIPDATLHIVWKLALSGCRHAQAFLADLPDKESRIIAALGSDQKECRATAVNWLVELGHSDATDAIRAALRKEKADAPKAAMLAALEHFGHSVEAYLTPICARKPPAAIAWFPVDQLPDSQLAPDILHALVIQAFERKSVAPSPMIRRSCASMAPDERAAFGNCVFRAWLAEDTKPKHTPEEAAAAADRDAAWYAGVYDDPEEVERYRERKYNEYLAKCEGGASASRGILAIAASFADSAILPAIEKYLNTYSGTRKSQCKFLRTLLVHLGQIAPDDQYAQRRGWTRDELADRCIPTAGFDAKGIQTIDYGDRRFQARIAAKFAMELTDADGAVIKRLPNAAPSEDANTVKAARQAFFDSTRDLKQIRRLQRERLFEAMCTRRAWRFEDWDRYLNRHPIVGRYCARLVWMSGETSFRPLPDGSLVDLSGSAAEIAADAGVKLAHSSELSVNDCEAWQTHLSDNSLYSLFEQFNAAYVLSEDQKLSTEITDFRGHMVNTLQLRRTLGRLNYYRGESKEGASFYTYHKTFPGLGLQAIIEFTGSRPKDDKDAALLSLYFERANNRLAPSRIPAILLGECWHDFRHGAEAGSGYDEDWEGKIG